MAVHGLMRLGAPKALHIALPHWGRLVTRSQHKPAKGVRGHDDVDFALRARIMPKESLGFEGESR